MSRTLGVPFGSPLRYMPETTNLIPVIKVSRAPTNVDRNYPICQMWLIGKNPSTGVEGALYYLERFDASGDAIWTMLSVTGTAGLVTLTTDGGIATIDGVQNIDLLGTAAQGVSTAGAGSTVTLTIADATAAQKGVASFNVVDFVVAAGDVVLGDTIVKSVGSDAGTATPVGNNVDIVGGTGISTSAAGDTITISVTGGLPGTFAADVGNATPAAGVITIAGGVGITTTAAGSTVTIDMDTPVTVTNGGTGAATFTDGGILIGNAAGAIQVTAAPTDGQVLIGVTGADPTLATLTAGNGIDITSAAGSITIGIDEPLAVDYGGTGAASFTEYAVICGGTAPTDPLQSIAAVGNAGEVLTSNGAAALPTFQPAGGGGGGWVLLDTQITNNTAEVVFTGLDSTYVMYGIVFWDVLPVNNNVSLRLICSVDGGVNYDAGVTYNVSEFRSRNYSEISPGMGNNANTDQSSGMWYLLNPSSTKYKGIYSASYFRWKGGVYYGRYGEDWGCLRESLTAYDAVKIYMSGGNILTGTFNLYGVAPSV